MHCAPLQPAKATGAWPSTSLRARACGRRAPAAARPRRCWPNRQGARADAVSAHATHALLPHRSRAAAAMLVRLPAAQEPKVRPSAKYLQQHKFAAAQRPGALAALVPLIARSQELIAEAAQAELAARAAHNGRCALEGSGIRAQLQGLGPAADPCSCCCLRALQPYRPPGWGRLRICWQAPVHASACSDRLPAAHPCPPARFTQCSVWQGGGHDGHRAVLLARAAGPGRHRAGGRGHCGASAGALGKDGHGARPPGRPLLRQPCRALASSPGGCLRRAEACVHACKRSSSQMQVWAKAGMASACPEGLSSGSPAAPSLAAPVRACTRTAASARAQWLHALWQTASVFGRPTMSAKLGRHLAAGLGVGVHEVSARAWS